jgi:hypothetical protein
MLDKSNPSRTMMATTVVKVFLRMEFFKFSAELNEKREGRRSKYEAKIKNSLIQRKVKSYWRDNKITPSIFRHTSFFRVVSC